MNLNLREAKVNYISIFLMAMPLILSAFTHLFNPIGFPCVHYDEGVYMRRAMHVLEGLGPQDPENRYDHGQETTSSYDHPYFGQLFLAGIFKLIGYPNSFVNTSAKTDDTLHSIEMLYLVPRVLMGLLAVVDTFLVYKIAERRYNRNVAVVASVLFAVMPLSWLIRRIYLDTILLPFLLSSILFATYHYRKDSKSADKYGCGNVGDSKTLIPILLSGIFLGLAIFTKIPAFTMIPVVGFLIFTKNNRNLKILGLWFIPVLLIPLMWPAYSVSVGQFNEWVHGVLWQGMGRHISIPVGEDSHQILGSIYIILGMDPVLIILAVAGVVFTTMRKDFLILLWIMPFLIFSYIIEWITYFHYILVLPAFCIAAATLIDDLSYKIRKKRVQILFVVFSAIGIFGLITTIILITTNFFASEFRAAAFAAWNVQGNNTSHHGVSAGNNRYNYFKNDDITIISGPLYSWIFKYVFGDDHVFHTRDSYHPIHTGKILLMVDNTYIHVLSRGEVEEEKQIKRLQEIYNSTDTAAAFADTGARYDFRQFPYTNIKECPILNSIEVKTNY